MESASLPARHLPERTWIGGLSFARCLWLVGLVALVAHELVAVFFLYQPIALDDMFQYDMLARSIAAGRGYRWYSAADVAVLRPYYEQFLDLDRLAFPAEGLRTTFRAPGYPFFLASLYVWVPAGARFILARLVQAALAAGLAVLAVILAGRAGFPRRTGLLAGLGIAFYPILLCYPLALASEDLYIPLGLAVLLLIHRAVGQKGWRGLILAGLAAGLLMLTRSIFAGFVLLAGGWLARCHPRGIRAGLTFALIAFGVCLPWSIRNTLLMGRPAFVENSAGYNLYIGAHPEGDGGFVSRIAIQPMNILDDGQREAVCLRQALGFIRENPLEFLRRVGVRLVKFAGPEYREFFYFYTNDLLGTIPWPGLALIFLLLTLPWAGTLVWGVFGLFQTADRRLTGLVLLYLLGYGLPHLVFIAEPRFHLAWAPVLAPFAVYGWQQRRGLVKTPAGVRAWLVYGALGLIAVVLGLALAQGLPQWAAILRAGGNRLSWAY